MTADGRVAFEVALSLASACFAAGFWVRRKELMTHKWPQAHGIIVTSSTRRQYVGKGQEEVLPIIEYEFDYGGKSVKSSHWRFGNYSLGNRESAEAIASRYAVGTPVTVFVNPREPTTSVLESGATCLSWIPIAFGIGLMLLSLIPLFEK
jgi:hypothetical protein